MSRLEKVLDSFFNVAAATCLSILVQPPDLVIALMHAGRFSLLAAQTLWQQTQTHPFPPTLKVNIGTEKMRRYEAVCNELEFRSYAEQNFDEWGTYHTYFILPRETGHFLAWVMRQEEWARELRSMMEEVLGNDAEPKRILLLEDFIRDGRSCLLAQGVLHRLYPNARLETLAGTVGNWRDDMVEGWLVAHHPTSVAEHLKATKYESANGLSYPTSHRLNRLLTGTADVDRESLRWQWRSSTDGHVVALRPFFDAETCLSLAEWAANTITEYIAQESARFEPDSTPVIRRCTLLPKQLISAHLWLHGCTSVAEAAAWAQVPEEETAEILDAYVKQEWAVWRERNGVRCCDLIRSGVLLYGINAESPGPDLEAITERVSSVMTPFPVEFVRSNGVHGPYLVPVAEGMGAPVPALLLQLQPDVDEDEIAARLISVESRLWGESRIQYFADKEAKSDDPIHIRQIQDFGGLDRVFYAEAQPNIPELDDVTQALRASAEHLKRVALQSADAADEKWIDGIAYLRCCLAQGIQTPLMDLYVESLRSEHPDLFKTASPR